MNRLGSQQGSITKEIFGSTKDGVPVDLYTLTNIHGLIARVMTYGAILTELHTPDRSGNLADIITGFDNLDQYLAGHPNFGATIGRYANRIAQGRFTLDGVAYSLPINNGPNSLHGGPNGFDKKVWKVRQQMTARGPSLILSCFSADGEAGYPGNLVATAGYMLIDSDDLVLDYAAATDQATVVNLTNHTYFNLSGAADILSHDIRINAHNYTPVDETLIPIGEIAPVAGTPLDFTSPHTVGDRIAQLQPNPGGYDHNFVLDAAGDVEALAARAHDSNTGRVLEVRTTQPGVQFYTGNFLDGSLTGKGGKVYTRHAAFCLETQHFPDSPNHPNFPSTVLRPGELYREATIWSFRTDPS